MNSWNSNPDKYAALLRKAFALGEKHAHKIVSWQLGCAASDVQGEGYMELSEELDKLYPKDEDPPRDACYAAGVAIGLSVGRGGAR